MVGEREREKERERGREIDRERERERELERETIHSARVYERVWTNATNTDRHIQTHTAFDTY